MQKRKQVDQCLPADELRSQGDQIRVCMPITIHHLKLFKLLLAISSVDNFDSLMIWAAMTLAFFGFLRLGELKVHLTRDSISFAPRIRSKGPHFMNVDIKESKTDPFRLGHTITVGATNSKICPIQALEKYISLRPPIGGPLFIHASGKPLTKQAFNKTRQLLTLIWV